MAAVQARIAQIESQFGTRAGTVVAAPVRTSAPATSAAAGTAFSQALTAQQASLAAPLPTSATAAPARGAATSSSVGEQVVALAQQHLGTPYVWGGESPGGFDCSGLMQWAYGQVGIDLPRVSRDQAKVGRAVSPAEARPGDLVFFERGAIDHIGLYAGGGKWVVAPKTGDVVKMQDVDLSKATTIRRVLPDSATAVAGSSAAGPATSAAPTARASRYAALFAAAGARHGISPALLTAVARAESGFDAGARSPAGAQGLMQLMPATAAGLGVDAWKPAEAVDGAARLLKQHLQRFGSTELALAAYNAGPGAVTKHGGIPPYAETKAYVAKIMAELSGGRS
jgi:cell wall-associated NlpC family hydrolase